MPAGFHRSFGQFDHAMAEDGGDAARTRAVIGRTAALLARSKAREDAHIDVPGKSLEFFDKGALVVHGAGVEGAPSAKLRHVLPEQVRDINDRRFVFAVGLDLKRADDGREVGSLDRARRWDWRCQRGCRNGRRAAGPGRHAVPSGPRDHPRACRRRSCRRWFQKSGRPRAGRCRGRRPVSRRRWCSSMRCTRKRPILVTAFVVITSSYFLIFDFLEAASSVFFSPSLAASGLAVSEGLSSAKLAVAGTSRQAKSRFRRRLPGRGYRCMDQALGHRLRFFKAKRGDKADGQGRFKNAQNQGRRRLVPGCSSFGSIVRGRAVPAPFLESALADGRVCGPARPKPSPLCSAPYASSSIPKGLCPPAQGCEARATLGSTSANLINPNGVAPLFATP